MIWDVAATNVSFPYDESHRVYSFHWCPKCIKLSIWRHNDDDLIPIYWWSQWCAGVIAIINNCCCMHISHQACKNTKISEKADLFFFFFFFNLRPRSWTGPHHLQKSEKNSSDCMWNMDNCQLQKGPNYVSITHNRQLYYRNLFLSARCPKMYRIAIRWYLICMWNQPMAIRWPSDSYPLSHRIAIR